MWVEKGGILIGIKSSSEVLSWFVDFLGKNIVKISVVREELFIIFVYLLGGYKKECEIDFGGLKNVMNEFRISGENKKLIFIGYVNARTGNEQG